MSKFEVYFSYDGPVSVTEDGVELDAEYLYIHDQYVEIGIRNQKKPLMVFREELDGVDELEGIGMPFIRF